MVSRQIKDQILKRPWLAEPLRSLKHRWRDWREEFVVSRGVRKTRAQLGNLILACGTGHCGTRWLAEILHNPGRGVVFYHEKRQHMAKVSWEDTIASDMTRFRPGTLEKYFSLLLKRLSQFETVGDSNSWAIPALLTFPSFPTTPSKIIYLVRNGIPTVDSFYRHNWPMTRMVGKGRRNELYASGVRRAWELMDWPGKKSWEEYTTWEAWCIWWRLNGEDYGPRLLREAGYKVQVIKVEDLDRSIVTAEQVLELLVNREKYQQDINRKIAGSRNPDDVYKTWSQEQRKQFQDLCGGVMEQYDYH